MSSFGGSYRALAKQRFLALTTYSFRDLINGIYLLSQRSRAVVSLSEGSLSFLQHDISVAGHVMHWPVFRGWVSQKLLFLLKLWQLVRLRSLGML
jgi:hypothetical protein